MEPNDNSKCRATRTLAPLAPAAFSTMGKGKPENLQLSLKSGQSYPGGKQYECDVTKKTVKNELNKEYNNK